MSMVWIRQPFPFDRIRVLLLNTYGEDIYPGADHYFNGHEAGLNAVISDWLDNLLPQED